MYHSLGRATAFLSQQCIILFYVSSSAPVRNAHVSARFQYAGLFLLPRSRAGPTWLAWLCLQYVTSRARENTGTIGSWLKVSVDSI